MVSIEGELARYYPDSSFSKFSMNRSAEKPHPELPFPRAKAQG
jgi:hypothetical protein